jgi:hypothetical protein
MKAATLVAGIALLAVPAFSVLAFPLKVELNRETLSPGSSPLEIRVQGQDGQLAVARILDARGRSVAHLQPAGPSIFVWDGRNSRGQNVAPGTYLIEVVQEPYLWNGAVSVQPSSH